TGEEQQQDQRAEQPDRFLHGVRLHHGTKKGSNVATSVTASEIQSAARTLRPVLTRQAAPVATRRGQYERQKPMERSENAAARKYGRYEPRPAAATAPLAPRTATPAGPAQQSEAKMATAAEPTAPRAEPVTAYLSFSSSVRVVMISPL